MKILHIVVVRVLNKTRIINPYIQKKLNFLFFLTIVPFYSQINTIGKQQKILEPQPRSVSVPSDAEMFYIPSVRKPSGSVGFGRYDMNIGSHTEQESKEE